MMHDVGFFLLTGIGGPIAVAFLCWMKTLCTKNFDLNEENTDEGEHHNQQQQQQQQQQDREYHNQQQQQQGGSESYLSVYAIKMSEIEDPPSYESVIADQGRVSSWGEGPPQSSG